MITYYFDIENKLVNTTVRCGIQHLKQGIQNTKLY